MDEHLVINLRVADKRYPLKIKRKEEEIFRMAANEIDYKLSQYKEYFTGDPTRSLHNTDYMAMTAIQAVAEKVELKFRTDGFKSKITDLIEELDEYLKEQK